MEGPQSPGEWKGATDEQEAAHVTGLIVNNPQKKTDFLSGLRWSVWHRFPKKEEEEVQELRDSECQCFLQISTAGGISFHT